MNNEKKSLHKNVIKWKSSNKFSKEKTKPGLIFINYILSADDENLDEPLGEYLNWGILNCRINGTWCFSLFPFKNLNGFIIKIKKTETILESSGVSYRHWVTAEEPLTATDTYHGIVFN